MKKKMILLAFLLAAGTWAFSQCNGKTTWQCSKLEVLDSTGKVIQAREDSSILELSEMAFNITPNQNRDEKKKGTVYNLTCNWKEAFKDGYSTFSTEITEPSGETKHGNVRIEATEGKLYLMIDLKEKSNMIFRVALTPYKSSN